MQKKTERPPEPEHVVIHGRFHWFFDLKSLGLLNAFTKLRVTDQRVLEKTGILSTRTQSIALNQIESTDVEQSVMGRLFGYGDLIIYGSGGKVFRFESLADPTAISGAIGRTTARQRQDGIGAAGKPAGSKRQGTAPPGKPGQRRPVS